VNKYFLYFLIFVIGFGIDVPLTSASTTESTNSIEIAKFKKKKPFKKKKRKKRKSKKKKKKGVSPKNNKKKKKVKYPFSIND
jgi:hypothetical protein